MGGVYQDSNQMINQAILAIHTDKALAMKKLTLCVIMIVLCSLTQKIKAQSVVGMKAGVNLSDFWISESAQFGSTMKAGLSIGNFLRCQFRDNVGLEADMMFRYQTSKMKDLATGETSDYHFLGFEVPVYGMIQADIEQNMLYLGFGPFASAGLFSRLESGGRKTDPYKKNETDSDAMMHRWNFGVGFIVGYELGLGLQFNINYQLGFRNVLDTNSGNASMIPQLMELGIGYRF